ncbi:hypothetical protein [Alkalibacillus almallahensis]|uniref:hypothetical protein n=1 Tax=Alkalibacillus almallahensis TaxID=1379154 RepID=UPI00141FB969|nr:hypothetical protein [Alkalibacillus almallahensis]NIK12883.1 hypothetical protein [Alkalibacillus almallahensis]
MGNLDPKLEYNGPLYSWENLNNLLQAHFNKPKAGPAKIDLRQYSISKDEIIAEAEKQGYKVYEHNEHYLKFE